MSTTPSVVGHVDPTSDRLLTEAVATLDAGGSVVVRPRAGYDGLDHALARIRSISAVPVLVTDLESGSSWLDPAGPGTSGEPGGPAAAATTDGPVVAFHTSGSTGRPKCVVYRRETILRHADTIAATLGLAAAGDTGVTTGTTYVALPPPRFAYGLSIVHSHHRCGVPVTFAPATWRLPEVSELAAATTGPLAFYLLPQHTPLLLSADLDPDRVERILVAGGRLSQVSARTLGERFPRLWLTNMYGQAEMGPRLACWHGRPADFVEGTIGSPLPGVELRLESSGIDAAEASPFGPQRGEILARSEFAMWRCLRAPYQAWEDGPGAGFVLTGDLGRVTDSGGIVHEGRGDQWLNVAGTKVDLGHLTRVVQERFHPLVVRVSSRAARRAGDYIPVVQLVPGPQGAPERVAIRRALHAEFGSLAGLVDVRVVEELALAESGK